MLEREYKDFIVSFFFFFVELVVKPRALHRPDSTLQWGSTLSPDIGLAVLRGMAEQLSFRFFGPQVLLI